METEAQVYIWRAHSKPVAFFDGSYETCKRISDNLNELFADDDNVLIWYE